MGGRGSAFNHSATARKREGYIKAMQPLQKKSVSRYVGSDKHITIKFNKRGIEHIADDILNKRIGIAKREISKLDDFLKDAKYVKSSGLYKERKDDITRFYYFHDKTKNLRYNVAEEEYKGHYRRYLYSIAKKKK